MSGARFRAGGRGAQSLGYSYRRVFGLRPQGMRVLGV